MGDKDDWLGEMFSDIIKKLNEPHPEYGIQRDGPCPVEGCPHHFFLQDRRPLPDGFIILQPVEREIEQEDILNRMLDDHYRLCHPEFGPETETTA